LRKVYFKIPTGAIGIEAWYTKAFLFYLSYLRENGVEPVAIITIKPSNQTLWRLIKRKFDELKVECIEIFNNRLLSIYYHRIKMRKVFKMHHFNTNLENQIDNGKRYLEYVIHQNHEYAAPPFCTLDFDAMNALDIFLNFSDEENRLAIEELQRMQLKKDFVCVHARDSVFYPDRSDDLRNTPFENFVSASYYLGMSGINSVRMGAKQADINKDVFNKNIIDYSGKYRTDFMDIWLVANCKFFLGNNSGFFYTSYLFNKPCAILNYPCFLESTPFGVNDIYTPQRLWDKKMKRFLTFKEISKHNIGLDWWEPLRFDREGIECIQITPQEILEVAKEMNEVLDGKYKYTEEDDYLQQKFKSVFKIYHAPYHTPARVGREFLKQNKELFL
jgi:putative glycosyltransferase (TIGR04372 family)